MKGCSSPLVIRERQVKPQWRVSWSLTKGQRQYNGEKTVFSINVAGTEHLYADAKKKGGLQKRLQI